MANYRELGFMADTSIFNDHLQDLELYKQKKCGVSSCPFLPHSLQTSASQLKDPHTKQKNVVPPSYKLVYYPIITHLTAPPRGRDSKNLFITS